jgi:polysaccharide deacetylase family protein (PEP-CTERM system associated)
MRWWPREVRQGESSGDESGERVVNAMSVDVEDYFQVSAFERIVSRASWDTFDTRVVRNTHVLLDTFDRHAVRATFFTLGWVAERHPGLVREIAARGHEVASHGFHHQLVYTLTPQQFREDVRKAKATLENAGGSGVFGYRAPSYSITKSSLWAFDILIEEGYLYDTSVFPIHHDRYGIPDAPRHRHLVERAGGTLVEMPASTVRVGSVNLPIAGGGYFRLLPYAWTRWGVQRVNTAERTPVVFYLHPWEIDTDQPRIPCGRVTRWRHYGGLDRTAPRLERLLREFRFNTVASVLDLSPSIAQKEFVAWPSSRQPVSLPH